MVYTASQRSSLLPHVNFQNPNATFAEKMRRLRMSISTSRRGLALFALGLLILALSGEFSALAEKYSGVTITEEPGAAPARTASAIIWRAAVSAAEEAKADAVGDGLSAAETEGGNATINAAVAVSAPVPESAQAPGPAAEAGKINTVASGGDGGAAVRGRAAVEKNSNSGAKPAPGMEREKAADAGEKQEEGSAGGEGPDAGCRHSSKDTNGLICVEDEMWHRILRADEAGWARINASLREAPDALGRPVRARYDAPHADYPETVDAGPHRWMRRDYLQAVWVPTLSCPEEVRVGESGDGGKWVCGLHRVGRRAGGAPGAAAGAGSGVGDDRCLIYSFGSNNLFGFESAMLEGTGGAAGGGCEIEVFDHTATRAWNPPASPRLRLHRLGIKAAKEAKAGGGGALLDSFAGLQQRLGHGTRRVDVLKMDVEGAEWAVLPEIVRGPQPPGQLLLETHLQSAPMLGTRDADSLLLALRAAGYAMTHTEVNYNGALNYNEYSFVHLASRTLE